MNDEELNRRLAAWARADAAGAGDEAAVQRMMEHGRTIALPPPLATHRLPRWRRMAGGGAIAASLLVAVIGVNLAQRHPAQPNAPLNGAAVQTITDDESAALASFATMRSVIRARSSRRTRSRASRAGGAGPASPMPISRRRTWSR